MYIASTIVVLKAFMERGRFSVILPQAPETRIKTSLIFHRFMEFIGSGKLMLLFENDDLPDSFSARQPVKAVVEVSQLQAMSQEAVDREQPGTKERDEAR